MVQHQFNKNNEMIDSTEYIQNHPEFPNKFRSGKFLYIKEPKSNPALFDLIDEFAEKTNLYCQGSDRILPSVAKLINKGVDLRCIFFLMLTSNSAILAKEFLEYLEENGIFFPIDKLYHSPPACPNFFTEVASLGDAGVTKALFKYGINGFKNKLKKYNLTEEEIKEKLNEFVEELFGLTPLDRRIPTMEYVISVISPSLLAHEGLHDYDTGDSTVDDLLEFAHSITDDIDCKKLSIQYHFPWWTIKTLVLLGLKYNIDLTTSESFYLESGKKLLDIIYEAADDKKRMSRLVKRFFYPYSEADNENITLESCGSNLQNYYFYTNIDGMHYNNKPFNILIKMFPHLIKRRCESIKMVAEKYNQ